MSPWWLRPPAEEVTDDEQPASRKEGSSNGGAPQDASEGSRRESTSPHKSADRDQQRNSRRRPQRGGQARRAGRQGEEEKAAPAQPRSRRRGRRGSPSGGTGSTAPKAAAGGRPGGEPSAVAGSLDNPPLGERRLAVVCDLESVALGLRQSGSRHFDVGSVLQRLQDKGKIIIKKAYADWDRHRVEKQGLHQAGMELIDIPQGQISGRSGADVRIAVDCMELCYSKQHLDTFVLISADGGLTPLVAKLKANNKHVVGVGPEAATPQILIDSCDEYLSFDAIRTAAAVAPPLENVEEGQAEIYALLVEAIQTLMQENHEILWGSVVKQAIQRRHPSFDESRHGYSSFSKLLEEAEKEGILGLRRDQRSGSYVVTGFGES